MNIDAAIFVEDRAFAIEIVIRDWAGRVVAAAARRFHGDMDAHRAEVVVAKEGLRLAWEVGLNHIVLEGDAKNIIECFDNNKRNFSHTGIILYFSL